MLNSNFDLRKFLTESKAPTQQIEEATLTEATVMEYIREKMDSMNNEVRSCMREYLNAVNEIDPSHEDAHAQLMNALEDFYNKLKAHFEEDAMDDAGEELATTEPAPSLETEELEEEERKFADFSADDVNDVWGEGEGPVYPEDKHLMTPDEFGGEEDEMDEWGQGSGIYYKGEDKEEDDEDINEDHSANPNDKYVVRPCKNKKEPWAVWEGEVRVKGFATKEEAQEFADKKNKEQGLNEGEYEPRTKEDLVYQYLRDAWQFGATKGKDVNPDEELSTMADSLLANLPDYDSAEKVEKPKEKTAFEKRLEKLAAAEKERRANLKEDTLNEDAGMYQPIVDGIMNLTNNKETALLIAGLVKTAVNVGTVPALAAALYVHKDKPLVRKVLDLPIMKKAIDFVKDED